MSAQWVVWARRRGGRALARAAAPTHLSTCGLVSYRCRRSELAAKVPARIVGAVFLLQLVHHKREREQLTHATIIHASTRGCSTAPVLRLSRQAAALLPQAHTRETLLLRAAVSEASSSGRHGLRGLLAYAPRNRAHRDKLLGRRRVDAHDAVQFRLGHAHLDGHGKALRAGTADKQADKQAAA